MGWKLAIVYGAQYYIGNVDKRVNNVKNLELKVLVNEHQFKFNFQIALMLMLLLILAI